MPDIAKHFKKKFTLACMFWATGTVLAFTVESSLSEFTAFSAIVLGLFKASDVADKRLNGGSYDD